MHDVRNGPNSLMPDLPVPFSSLRRLPPHIWTLLKQSWLEFARFERRSIGLPSFIPFFKSFGQYGSGVVEHSCFCRKSAIGFPHWPPSSYQEAVEQLRCVLGKDIRHRKYLAFSWFSWVNSSTQTYGVIGELIENACPAFVEERRKEGLDRMRRQAQLRYRQTFSCSAFCEPALRQNSSYCLCFCPRHRDMCPSHRVSLSSLWQCE
jgi:hypothetical protein